MRGCLDASLAICEGSDWFWWFGDYNPRESVATFDRLFRDNLASLYRLLKLPRDPREPRRSRVSHGACARCLSTSAERDAPRCLISAVAPHTFAASMPQSEVLCSSSRHLRYATQQR